MSEETPNPEIPADKKTVVFSGNIGAYFTQALREEFPNTNFINDDEVSGSELNAVSVEALHIHVYPLKNVNRTMATEAIDKLIAAAASNDRLYMYLPMDGRMSGAAKAVEDTANNLGTVFHSMESLRSVIRSFVTQE